MTYTQMEKEDMIENKWGKYTDLELLELLKKEIKRIGIEERPSRTEYQKKYNNDNTPAPNTYMYRMKKTWKEIIDIIGLEYEKEDLKYFAGKSNKGKKFNSKWKISDKEMVAIVKKFIDENHINSSLEYNTIRKESKEKMKLPSSGTIILRFGSWRKFWGTYIKK